MIKNSYQFGYNILGLTLRFDDNAYRRRRRWPWKPWIDHDFFLKTMIYFFEDHEKWQKFENDHEVLLERPWKSPKMPKNGPWKPWNDHDFFGKIQWQPWYLIIMTSLMNSKMSCLRFLSVLCHLIALPHHFQNI